MNIKKATLLLGLFPLLLSCAGNSPIGEYAFQMGKTKDTHISVSLKLTKDNYDENDVAKGKKFELSLDMVTNDVEDSFSSLLKSVTPITGFYNIDKNNKVYNETRLDIGISLLGETEIPQTITDLIFVASITNNAVNFYLPVSIEDLTYQLYWYGYDVNLANLLGDESADPLATPEGKHPIGSHPTQADIDAINQHYGDDHSGDPFRDFHVLKLGLTKK